MSTYVMNFAVIYKFIILICVYHNSQSILVFATTVGSVHSLSHVGAWDETKQGHKDNSWYATVGYSLVPRLYIAPASTEDRWGW